MILWQKNSMGLSSYFRTQSIGLIMQILETLSSLFPFLVAMGLGFPLLLKKLWGRGWSVVMQVTKVCIVYVSFAIR